ncbi:MAG: GNAT family N-acetyltransferase [Acetobacterium sp.]|nr:GNAT family N-acetyltransferase [Acetobacterium sp.]
MLGAIIGDIAGSRFEFNNHRSKDFELFAETCEVTDDSIMTLAVAKAIMEAGKYGCLPLENGISNREYYRRVETLTIKTMPEIGRNYPHCGYGGRFGRWIFSECPQPYNSFGNGAAMRISPAAFAARSEAEARILSEVITRVTHNHPEGLKGAEAVAVAIYMARNGAGKDAIRDRINTCYYQLDFTIDEIRDTYQFNETCQETVPQAIQAFWESTSFDDAIRTAISVGGDSDTLAAITGAIAEAYYEVPKELEEKALSHLDADLREIYDEWQSYLKTGPRTIVIREANPEERELLFRDGYQEWSKNRTLEEYVRDNSKEDHFGKRFVIDLEGKIVSSLIVLNLEAIMGKPIYGIGSVLTPKPHTGKGYATMLLKNCIKQIEKDEDALIFLFSDINPDFYKKLGFSLLPKELQKSGKSPCMVRCGELDWHNLLEVSIDRMPAYF